MTKTYNGLASFILHFGSKHGTLDIEVFAVSRAKAGELAQGALEITVKYPELWVLNDVTKG